MRANHLLFFLSASILFFSCKKETEEFQTEALSTYLPTQTGKYIIYRLDSAVAVNFGAAFVTRSYQEKHQVDALTTDNLGRPAYRVFRYIRDTAGLTAWQPSGSYFITPSDNTIEVVENNLRFLKLAAPIKEGNSWMGNRFLPTDAYGSLYEFSNDDGMEDWNYNYAEVDGTVSLGGKSYSNTITVNQDIEFSETNVKAGNNYLVSDVLLFGSKSYAVEKYSKNIGLVYQEIIMWEYQPIGGPRPGYRGFGVKRSILDYN